MLHIYYLLFFQHKYEDRPLTKLPIERKLCETQEQVSAMDKKLWQQNRWKILVAMLITFCHHNCVTPAKQLMISHNWSFIRLNNYCLLVFDKLTEGDHMLVKYICNLQNCNIKSQITYLSYEPISSDITFIIVNVNITYLCIKLIFIGSYQNCISIFHKRVCISTFLFVTISTVIVNILSNIILRLSYYEPI